MALDTTHVQTNEYPQNLDARLINPFLGQSPERMDRLVDVFMETTGIDNKWHEHIRKGAFLAQDRDAFTRSREDRLQLEPDEQEALMLEHPKFGNSMLFVGGRRSRNG
ncbi:MAG: hypothetical protein M1830_009319 [Pleopsidium flavum]|nr:MAG: hypothetical protein M1830_009319 [Pleopsidium flavum]